MGRSSCQIAASGANPCATSASIPRPHMPGRCVRFRTAEDTEFEPAMEKVRAIVEAHPRVLADPAPSVLLDRRAAENTIEIVVAFSTAEDTIAAVKSDLIKAVHAASCAEHGKTGNGLSVGAAE